MHAPIESSFSPGTPFQVFLRAAGASDIQIERFGACASLVLEPCTEEREECTSHDDVLTSVPLDKTCVRIRSSLSKSSHCYNSATLARWWASRHRTSDPLTGTMVGDPLRDQGLEKCMTAEEKDDHRGRDIRHHWNSASVIHDARPFSGPQSPWARYTRRRLSESILAGLSADIQYPSRSPATPGVDGLPGRSLLSDLDPRTPPQGQPGTPGPGESPGTPPLRDVIS
jgi:hypothetical protein